MNGTLLYGGTFDPPHIAHVTLPHEAMNALSFDRVLYIPAHQSPLKDEPQTSAAHRLQMLTLALQDSPWAEISTIELDRGGTSYTIDTIEALQHPDEEIRLLVGADQWAQIREWKRWEDIIRIANPIVLPRSGYDVQDQRIVEITPMPEVSTDIRHCIQQGMPITGLVPPRVATYIAQHNLYQ